MIFCSFVSLLRLILYLGASVGANMLSFGGVTFLVIVIWEGLIDEMMDKAGI